MGRLSWIAGSTFSRLGELGLSPRDPVLSELHRRACCDGLLIFVGFIYLQAASPHPTSIETPSSGECAKMANPTARKTAPYKDFLSPALHGRFQSTVAFLVALAYVEALVLADWSSCESAPTPPTAWPKSPLLYG